jgi:hypothetical protein
LTLFKLIEKTILAQTEDQYPFATVYEQEISIYSFNQHSLTNEQWYERFNTNIDVGSAIGVTRQHRVLLEHVAAENGGTTPFDELNEDEQKDVRENAKEQYHSYVFLRQSGKQHAELKTDLQNDSTTGDDRYPKNRQSTLHLLDKYSKSAPAIHTPSEGTAFTQKGGREGNRDKETFNAKYWKDKDCYNCNKQGHPSSHCPEKKKKAKPFVVKQNDDDTSRSSKSFKASITKMHKKIKKSFATLQSKIDEMDEDSELSSSDSDDDEQSHFQFSDNKITRMPTENGIALQQTFTKRNTAVLLKQSDGKPSRLDLRNVILLDTQSTMDLICNKSLVANITTANNKMRLQSNGGSMTVTQKATMSGYKKKVWYSKDAITNIIALSNLIQQYHVTYDSRDQIFVVHREDQGKPNMEFRMHESGLHYFQPGKEDFVFVSTVSGNREGYTQRQLKGAESARDLYAKLGYPSH